MEGWLGGWVDRWMKRKEKAPMGSSELEQPCGVDPNQAEMAKK